MKLYIYTTVDNIVFLNLINVYSAIKKPLVSWFIYINVMYTQTKLLDAAKTTISFGHEENELSLLILSIVP